MYKYAIKNLIRLLIIVFCIITFMLPYEHFLFHTYCTIFPALDLAIIYYYSTHNKLHYWQLFIIGILLDQLQTTPNGLNSLVLILAQMSLIYSGNYLLFSDYFTNVLMFCSYSAFIILLKYLVITATSNHYIEFLPVLFYFFTTILVYPTMYIMLEYISTLLKRHA